MKIISLTCPSCGAGLENIKVRDGMGTCFCTYCGTKIAIQDENQFTYRQIDAARIKEVEAAQAIRMKELEMEERRRKDQRKRTLFTATIALILATIGLLMIVVGYLVGSASGISDSPFYVVSLMGFFPILAGAFVAVVFLPNNEKSR